MARWRARLKGKRRKGVHIIEEMSFPDRPSAEEWIKSRFTIIVNDPYYVEYSGSLREEVEED